MRALVVQGGGMRGAYAAGVLIGLFDQGATFDRVYATSSGAASAAYAVAGQREGIDIWRDHLHGRLLVHPTRLLWGGNALDLEYLIDEVFRRRVPLDVSALRASGVPLDVPVTNVDTGRVEYYDLAASDPFEVLRASMSLPGAVNQAVTIEGKRYVDGGVIDQVPIGRALAQGADDVLVVATRPASYVGDPTGRFGLWLASRKFPKIRGALEHRHEVYRDAVRLMASPPAGVRVRVIRPPEGFPLSRWTTSRRRLLAAIDRGFEDANRSRAQ